MLPAPLPYDVAEHDEARPSVARSALQNGVRLFHRVLAMRQLEGKVSIYFHELGPSNWHNFRACIEHFHALGYRTVPPSEFVVAARHERCLFISFDDNFRDWHAALPMFRELGVRATFYVNTSSFRDVADSAEIARYCRRLRLPETCETLSRDELRQIRADGHVIGCHSHSHYLLAELPPALWDQEIAQSKHALEVILGEEVEDFAWPYGMHRHFSEELRGYCRDLAFKTIANAISGCQRIAGDDPFDIYRTAWRLERSLGDNLADLRIDGRLYARMTGRSVTGY